MIGKLHNFSKNKILAVCDSNLVNTKIILKNFEIMISSSFFGEKIISEKEVLDFFKDCDSVNCFGKKSCGFFINNNLINKDQVIFLNKVPHVQIYKI
ncbi:MAG: DUF424 family protein [Candidatus ainarchaeum sp.]|nr:DUF424 family protein [Candidatus ainarchaeum sp.]